MLSFKLSDLINLAPMTYELNYDYFTFHSINCSPISYTQLECPFECAAQRFRDNTLEILRKPSEPSQNSSGYWLIKPFKVFCCSLSPLNLNQSGSLPHDVGSCLRDFSGAFSVPV